MGASTINWTDIAVAITAILAIAVSLVSLAYSHASLKLAKSQDQRREPRLSASILDGFYERSPGQSGRIYVFHLLVNNQSDADNAVARAEFRLTYKSAVDFEMTALFPVAVATEESVKLPLRIAAHDSTAGWYRFAIPADILSPNRIERYSVELTDTHNNIVSLAPLILSERKA